LYLTVLLRVFAAKLQQPGSLVRCLRYCKLTNSTQSPPLGTSPFADSSLQLETILIDFDSWWRDHPNDRNSN